MARIELLKGDLQELFLIGDHLKVAMLCLLKHWPKGKPFRVTSIYRTPEHDRELRGSGIHASPPPFRAIDIGGAYIPPSNLRAAAEKVNDLLLYDPNRPWLSVAVSKPHGTGAHVHLQVHPLTDFRRRHINE